MIDDLLNGVGAGVKRLNLVLIVNVLQHYGPGPC